MKIQPEVARQLLQTFDFKTLFREQLGWDNYTAELPLQLDGTEYRLSGIAHKRGFAVYLCDTLPDSATRLKLYRRASKATHEQLIIYTDRAGGVQVWHWERREGSTIAPREERYDTSKSGEALIQKLEVLAVDIEEEESLTLPDVKARTKIAFDKERVTRRFYDTFKTEHKSFMAFIKGIKATADLEWYTSLMMNRMMFIYFIQKKGFLDRDINYLRNRLRLVQERRGRDKFHTFYRYFLLRLFHEGLGSDRRNPELDALLGKVPYLNGGFFEVHELERKYEIDIPDKAFEQLFEFFDAWEWTLDDRPLRKDNEINPDVVGYIFEKYINQKQMGAYYTKEDITEYISKNTVIPHLFDAAKKECAVAFRPDGLLWRMLQADPDRYIYEPVRRGVIDDKGQIIPLPPEIEAGIGDVSKRGGWNRPADPQFALPTETWREHVARRKRCVEIRAKLAAGEVHEVNDLVTLNLDIWQFARDAITNAEGPELLRAFWHALQKLTVLDPACGSGAFLFAALRILETLYGACIERMRQFLDDLDRSGEKHRPEKFKDFRQVLADIEAHPNQNYYVLKSIIINNLYGVDIMEEAVEICKLRLFLKLAAQVRTVDEIEPLPDIDFNIRAGNSLVGFASLDSVREAMTRQPDGQARMLYAREQAALKKIEEQAETADRQFQLFRQMQTEKGMRPSDFASAKAELRKRLDVLRLELDRYLAREYGIDLDNATAFKKWRTSHQPFHWFVEFYTTIRAGGFDTVIGNPPYVEQAKVREHYAPLHFQSESCANLFAFFLERGSQLTEPLGQLGFIVPMSLVSTGRMGPIFKLLRRRYGSLYLSHYSGDAHPSTLFTGVKMRLSIVLGHRPSAADNEHVLYSTQFIRWYSQERERLFPNIGYVLVRESFLLDGLLPKLGGPIEVAILAKIYKQAVQLGSFVADRGSSNVYAHRIVAHFVKAFDFVPYFWNERDGKKRSEDYKVFPFASTEKAILATSILNSTTFYFFYLLYSDAYHCGRELILAFPCDLGAIQGDAASRLVQQTKMLMKDLKANSTRRKIKYHGTGEIRYDEFYPRRSKSLIDEIDRTLGDLYGFDDEELDAIVHYDIKYRMGQTEAEDAE
jgi:hypothetical protein